MTRPKPIKPRETEAKALADLVVTYVVRPSFRQLVAQLSGLSLQAALAFAQKLSRTELVDEGAAVPFEKVAAVFSAIQTRHQTETITSFKLALDIDIRSVLRETEVKLWLEKKTDEYVALIKTLPKRLHKDLLRRLVAWEQETPFSQSDLKALLKDVYDVTSYNLRRLVRDLDSKLVGALTEFRQRQLGIAKYEWLTVSDQRVRPTHAANAGQLYTWTQPPPTGHPGFELQCRCVAYPLVTRREEEELKRRIRHD